MPSADTVASVYSFRPKPLSPRYGDEMRPTRPGKVPTRTPVIKLGATVADYVVPGPGSYSPRLTHKERASAWVLGERGARKSAVMLEGDSPGPVYQMAGSVQGQTQSSKASSPRFGFGTQPRLQGSPEMTISPGPGAYSPRVTKFAAPSYIQTVAAGQLTELTTPRGSIHNTEGTWSRMADRDLEKPTDYPSADAYTPSIDYTSNKVPSYTMRPLGMRQGLKIEGSETVPGPLAYHPTVKSRFGGGHLGDTPNYSCAHKDDNKKMFISNAHARVWQGLHSPSPAAYTPLEQLGVTSYTVSNTSTHSPQYVFGTEARPCAP